MIPGMWLNEGGQSAAGAAIERLIAMHPAAAEAAERARQGAKTVPDWLMDRALSRANTASELVGLAEGLHVVPEFLGNRAPHADPRTRAVIAGLGMDTSMDSLEALYIAGLCGLGYGLRQIIETQARHGAPISNIVVSGGGGRSDAVRQVLADTTGVTIVGPDTEEPVLLGAAMLGACAAGTYTDLAACMSRMSRVATRHQPTAGPTQETHRRRFDFFERFQKIAREIAHS